MSSHMFLENNDRGIRSSVSDSVMKIQERVHIVTINTFPESAKRTLRR